jgi:nicotinamidase-related amidase
MNLPLATTAILLVDPLNDFLSEGGKLWPYAREVAARLDLKANLARILAAARSRDVPVFYVPHHRFADGDYSGWKFLTPPHERNERLKPFERGTWGADFVPELAPQPGDVIVAEHWLHSGFANTDLAYQLQIRGIDHVALAGMRGNTCIEATARAAVELGFHVTIVKDASGTFRWDEWTATMEINAPGIVHAMTTTAELVTELAEAVR